MIRLTRLAGIAIGSLVIAYLAVSLVATVFLGPGARDSWLFGLVIVVVGGLVFEDIVRRDRPRKSAVGSR
jgi:hypothetical protein